MHFKLFAFFSVKLIKSSVASSFKGPVAEVHSDDGHNHDGANKDPVTERGPVKARPLRPLSRGAHEGRRDVGLGSSRGRPERCSLKHRCCSVSGCGKIVQNWGDIFWWHALTNLFVVKNIGKQYFGLRAVDKR